MDVSGLSYGFSDAREGASVVLGVASVLCWAVAEVPQIHSNYRLKSTDGLSLAFLITWIVGDFFNVMGCLLEPATLATQFYMALLFTATTLLLTGQTIYYTYFYHHETDEEDQCYEDLVIHSDEKIGKTKCVEDVMLEKQSKESNDLINRYTVIRGPWQPSSPVPVASPLSCYGSHGKEFYYMSARSLSMSPKPSAGSSFPHSHDHGRTSLSVTDQSNTEEPLLNGIISSESALSVNTKNMLCVASSSLLLVGTMGFHLFNGAHSVPQGVVMVVGRKLLQDAPGNLSLRRIDGSNRIGNFLGWAMAVIYMGGRLPQICLNIKRGNVEGLSPLMFTFALFGNATYIASILVRSLDWVKIVPNLPWLVDAGGCVILDIFILIQFIYFRYRASTTCKTKHHVYI